MADKFLGLQYPLVKTTRGLLAQKKGVDQIKADLLQLLLTNPGERCVTGDTKIPLANGTTKSIKELTDGNVDFWVYSFDAKSNRVVPGKAKAFKTVKDAELLEIILDNEEIVRCTPNHLWLLRDGNYKTADKLKIGDSLMPFYRNLNTSGYERIYQPSMGYYKETHLCFVFEERQTGIREVVHHADLNKRNNSPDNLQWMTCKDHKNLHKKISNAFIKKLEDPKFKEEWIQKIKHGLEEYYKTHDGNRKDVILSSDTRELLSEVKNKYYKTKEGEITKQKLSKCAIEQFSRDGHPSSGRKHTEETKAKMRKEHPSMQGDNNPSKRPEVREKLKLAWQKRKQKNHKVIAVKKLDYKEDCYDLHVCKHHNFAISVGVFVHNCMLPEYGTPLRELFFDPNDFTLKNKAKNMIAESITRWEPRIALQNVSVSNSIDPDDLHPDDPKDDIEHILSIKIEFFDPDNITEIQELKLEVPIA